MARTYDRVVTLLRKGAGEDKYGDPTQDFGSLAEGIPARRRLAPGSERLASAEVAASAPVVFYIPWAPQYADLNPADRVSDGTRTYDVQSANELGRRSEIEIAAVGRTD